jgi:hypothetical protein
VSGLARPGEPAADLAGDGGDDTHGQVPGFKDGALLDVGLDVAE